MPFFHSKKMKRQSGVFAAVLKNQKINKKNKKVNNKKTIKHTINIIQFRFCDTLTNHVE